MNSIELLRSDFNSQVHEVGKISNDKISDDLIFVGSGDSYTAGLFAEYYTGHKCKCYSPSDLYNSGYIDGKTYCFVSVTGKTIANIKVAESVRKAGIRSVAVTFNDTSPLAQICNKVIPLKIKRILTPTAGFSTFVANVVTCLQIAGVQVPNDFDTWHRNAIKLSQDFIQSFTISENTYLLGNNLLYPLALYASMQIAEFFGITAVAHKLEEFCHSPVFGLKKSDNVWMFGQNEGHVYKTLKNLNSNISYVELYDKDLIAQIFTSIFFVQNLILSLAEKYGYTELQYTVMKDILKASSGIIYED
jgi:glutamine---fructose-6-phosphate transaminase (isomerizing)